MFAGCLTPQGRGELWQPLQSQAGFKHLSVALTQCQQAADRCGEEGTGGGVGPHVGLQHVPGLRGDRDSPAPSPAPLGWAAWAGGNMENLLRLTRRAAHRCREGGMRVLVPLLTLSWSAWEPSPGWILLLPLLPLVPGGGFGGSARLCSAGTPRC